MNTSNYSYYSVGSMGSPDINGRPSGYGLSRVAALGSAAQHSSSGLQTNRVGSNLHLQESEFEDLYQNDLDSNYNEYNSHLNQTFNYPQFYQDVNFHKWERVISEENIEDEECKEQHSSQTTQRLNSQVQFLSQGVNRRNGASFDPHNSRSELPEVYNKVIYTPRTGHAVVEHGGVFYLFAGADQDSRTNDMYKFNPVTKQWHQIFQTNVESHSNNLNMSGAPRGLHLGVSGLAQRNIAMND